MAKNYDKEQLLLDWRAGEFTHEELAYKHGISRTRVTALVKGIPKDLSGIVTKKVQVEQTLKNLSNKENLVIDIAVKHQLGLIKDIELFSNRAMRMADKLLTNTDSGQDFKHIVDAVDRISITNKINERHAKPSVITQNTQNNYDQLSDSDLKQELQRIKERMNAIN